MCGRFAQTTNATHVAASSFGVSRASKASDISAHGRNSDSVDDFSSKSGELGNGDRDNYNMSPGMDAAVIWMENGELKMDRKVYVRLYPSVSIAQVSLLTPVFSS